MGSAARGPYIRWPYLAASPGTPWADGCLFIVDPGRFSRFGLRILGRSAFVACFGDMTSAGVAGMIVEGGLYV